MAILVRVPPQVLEDLVSKAILKQGRIYRGELAKMIGASKESLDEDLVLPHQPHEALRTGRGGHGKGPQKVTDRQPARRSEPRHFSRRRTEGSHRQCAGRIPDTDI